MKKNQKLTQQQRGLITYIDWLYKRNILSSSTFNYFHLKICKEQGWARVQHIHAWINRIANRKGAVR